MISSFIFLLILIISVVLIYVLFFGYSQISERYLGKTISGLSAGFILFLAVNEILALPFLLLHSSFNSYYPFFLLLNIPVFIFGIIQVVGIFRLKHRLIFKPTLLTILAILVVISCAGITQFYVKYDADDSYYVSLIHQNLYEDELYKTDPSTGNKELRSSSVYSFEAWELILSALTHTFRMDAVIFAHSFVPLLIIPLVFLAHRIIFQELLKKRSSINLGIIFLGVLFMFSGYSLYSQGTFLLTRVWQGKAIVATLIIPLLLYILYRLYINKGSKKKNYLAICILNIASVCLNPAAIFINIAAISVFGSMILFKYRRVKELLGLTVSSLPLVMAGLGVLILSSSNASTADASSTQTVIGTSWLEYLSRFIGSSWYFYIYILGLIYILTSKMNKRSLILFLIFPTLLFVTILNPLVFEFFKANITSNAYWRLFWLVPITIAVPYFGVIGATIFSKYSVTVIPRKWRSLINPMSYSVVIVLLIISGSFMFDTSKPFIAHDVSRSKVPIGVDPVAHFMRTVPSGNVLATTQPAAYLHNFTEKHQLLVSRELYLQVYYPENSDDFRERTKMMKIIEAREPDFNFLEFDELLDKYKVDYLIYASDNIYVDKFIKHQKYPVIFTVAEYRVVQIR